MKVFISWSGKASQQVATCLADWMQRTIQAVRPWVSTRDLEAGASWPESIGKELAATDVGVLCVTRSNMSSPWLLFEAGALAKATDRSRVVPYRLGVRAEDVRPPLGLLQGVDADKDGTWRLLEMLNGKTENPVSSENLRVIFDAMWPDLAGKLQYAKSEETKIDSDNRDNGGSVRSERDISGETLTLCREVWAKVNAIESALGRIETPVVSDAKCLPLEDVECQAVLRAWQQSGHSEDAFVRLLNVSRGRARELRRKYKLDNR